MATPPRKTRAATRNDLVDQLLAQTWDDMVAFVASRTPRGDLVEDILAETYTYGLTITDPQKHPQGPTLAQLQETARSLLITACQQQSLEHGSGHQRLRSALAHRALERLNASPSATGQGAEPPASAGDQHPQTADPEDLSSRECLGALGDSEAHALAHIFGQNPDKCDAWLDREGSKVQIQLKESGPSNELHTALRRLAKHYGKNPKNRRLVPFSILLITLGIISGGIVFFLQKTNREINREITKPIIPEGVYAQVQPTIGLAIQRDGTPLFVMDTPVDLEIGDILTMQAYGKATVHFASGEFMEIIGDSKLKLAVWHKLRYGTVRGGDDLDPTGPILTVRTPQGLVSFGLDTTVTTDAHRTRVIAHKGGGFAMRPNTEDSLPVFEGREVIIDRGQAPRFVGDDTGQEPEGPRHTNPPGTRVLWEFHEQQGHWPGRVAKEDGRFVLVPPWLGNGTYQTSISNSHDPRHKAGRPLPLFTVGPEDRLRATLRFAHSHRGLDFHLHCPSKNITFTTSIPAGGNQWVEIDRPLVGLMAKGQRLEPSDPIESITIVAHSRFALERLAVSTPPVRGQAQTKDGF